MRISEQGKKLLVEWEGLKTHEYLDSGKAPTIGVGHLLTAGERFTGTVMINGKLVNYRNGLTEAQCMDLLTQDMERYEKAVSSHVNVPFSQNQFDALVSFVFNVGVAAFKRSTLVRLLNQGKYDQVPKQLRKWTWDNGRPVKGLINRREKEVALWNSNEEN